MDAFQLIAVPEFDAEQIMKTHLAIYQNYSHNKG